jgi:4-amino-4-deoxy-L-arabinose transferase-like glycosyltransferase
MNKTILFGSLLVVFLLLMMPNIKAVEYEQVKQTRNSFLEEYLSDRPLLGNIKELLNDFDFERLKERFNGFEGIKDTLELPSFEERLNKLRLFGLFDKNNIEENVKQYLESSSEDTIDVDNQNSILVTLPFMIMIYIIGFILSFFYYFNSFLKGAFLDWSHIDVNELEKFPLLLFIFCFILFFAFFGIFVMSLGLSIVWPLSLPIFILINLGIIPEDSILLEVLFVIGFLILIILQKVFEAVGMLIEIIIVGILQIIEKIIRWIQDGKNISQSIQSLYESMKGNTILDSWLDWYSYKGGII